MSAAGKVRTDPAKRNQAYSKSDIVAELPCPHSGILTYEEDLPNPNYTAAVQDGFDYRIIESYSAQLFLRRHLNQLHNMFYKPQGEGK